MKPLRISEQGYEYLEMSKEQYDLLNEALKEMDTRYYTTDDFINTQIKEVLEKYQKWKTRTKE